MPIGGQIWTPIDRQRPAGRRRKPALPGFARPGRHCRHRCPAWTPSGAGSCADRGAGRPRSGPCPVRTPGCARARRRRATGSRRWKPISRGFARPGPCCRGRSTAARASSRRRRAPGAHAASSTAPPASMSAPKSTTRRPMCASADGAGNPMRRTAPRNPPSSGSRSRPTSA